MGLFRKKKQKERNEIQNQELKETIANTALRTLRQGVDYQETENTLCEFGYLFEIDGHGVEALFKITTDKGIFYFAAQKASVIRLDFNEELFRGATETFLSLHS